MSRQALLFAPLAMLLPLLSCAPAGEARGPSAAEVPPARAQAPLPDAATAPGSSIDDALCAPLLLDNDYAFGAQVVMRRLPTAADLQDFHYVSGVRQVLIALAEWPASYAELRPLQEAIRPDGVELVVLLQGWPPTREALGAWNLVGGALRIIMVVDGPPTDRALIAELNRLRPLERVIAQMREPTRTGFERLQRPLSFRVLRD